VAAFWVPAELAARFGYPALVTTAAVVAAGRSKELRSTFTTSNAAINATAAVTAPNVKPMKRRLGSSAMENRLKLFGKRG